MDASLVGAYGELVTGVYLRQHGCKIVDVNYRSRFGEIDVIAKNSRHMIFCEVKTRSSHGAISAADAVDAGKRKRIVLTVQKFLARYGIRLQPRLDVAEVYLDGDEVAEFNYIKNAYTLD